jgi:hypothetical protein
MRGLSTLSLTLVLMVSVACSSSDAPPSGDARVDRGKVDGPLIDRGTDSTYPWPDGALPGRPLLADGSVSSKTCSLRFQALTKLTSSGKATRILAFPDLVVTAEPYAQPQGASERGTLRFAKPPFSAAETPLIDMYSGPWGFGTSLTRVAVGIVAGYPVSGAVQLDDPRSRWANATRYKRNSATEDLFGQSVVMADVAGDSRPELLIAAPGDPVNACASNSGVYLFNQLPIGGLVLETDAIAVLKPTFRCGGWTMASADINGDGKHDLVLGSWGNGAQVLYGPLPAGRIDPMVDGRTLFFDRLEQIALRLGDVDGDGSVDLVVSERTRTLVLLGPLSPTHELRNEAIELTGRLAGPLTDLDGDGALDMLLIVGAKQEQLVVAQKPFSPQPKVTTLLTTQGAIAEADAADVTGDGCPEIALVAGEQAFLYTAP